MTDGRISPRKVFRISRLVIVTKLVMITSSFGIIIRERNKVKARFFPLNSSLAKAKADSVITTIIIEVVATVKISVFSRYFPRGTAVKASA